MRRILKRAGWVALALVLTASAVAVWKRDEIARLLAVNTLFSEDRIVANFSGMDRAFLTAPVPRGDGPVSPLRRRAPMTLPPQVAGWIAARRVTSLLVLKGGRIAHESYHLGTTAADRRIGWSMAKSFVSVLVGISLARGEIASLDDPVTRYAPALAGSAYDGVTLRQLLQMTSGVAFDEDYLDYDSDINRMGRVLALGGSMDGFAAGLDRPRRASRHALGLCLHRHPRAGDGAARGHRARPAGPAVGADHRTAGARDRPLLPHRWRGGGLCPWRAEPHHARLRALRADGGPHGPLCRPAGRARGLDRRRNPCRARRRRRARGATGCTGGCPPMRARARSMPTASTDSISISTARATW